MSTTYYLNPRIRYDKYSKLRKGYPIWLRFSYKNAEAWKPTGVYISDASWWHDKSKLIIGGPLLKQKNAIIENAFQEAEKRLITAKTQGEEPSIAHFKGNSMASFETYMNEIAGGDNSLSGTLYQMKEFHKCMPEIEHITVRWLRQFEEFMINEQELKVNSVRNYMSTIRKVMNTAVREGYIQKAPFGKELYQLPKKGETFPKFLIEDERNKLYKCMLNNTLLSPETYKVLVYAMLGTFSGLRFSDWAVFNIDQHIQDDKIVLITQKTQGKVVIPIIHSHPLEQVINIIRKIGPLDISYTTVDYHLQQIKKKLEITKDLTTHVFRHSFGYLCASLGYSKQITARLMGITEDIVEVYYHLTESHFIEQFNQVAQTVQAPHAA